MYAIMFILKHKGQKYESISRYHPFYPFICPYCNYRNHNRSFDDNVAINGGISNLYRDTYNLDYYETASYVKSLDALSNQMQTYFNSFDIFNIFSWFGL